MIFEGLIKEVRDLLFIPFLYGQVNAGWIYFPIYAMLSMDTKS